MSPGARSSSVASVMRERRRTVLVLEVLDAVLDELVVDVLSTEPRVAAGRHDLEHGAIDRQHRDIERSTAKVIDQDALDARSGAGLGQLRRQAVGDGGGRGLVQHSSHFKACNLSGILGGLALRIIKVRWHRDLYAFEHDGVSE